MKNFINNTDEKEVYVIEWKYGNSYVYHWYYAYNHTGGYYFWTTLENLERIYFDGWNEDPNKFAFDTYEEAEAFRDYIVTSKKEQKGDIVKVKLKNSLSITSNPKSPKPL